MDAADHHVDGKRIYNSTLRHRRLRRGQSVTCSMLSRLLPLLVSLIFWRKKSGQSVPGPVETGGPETEQTVKESDASRSRDILKVLTLEREIIGTALTTIYESEVQGIITREERDRLIDKYSQI